MEYRVQASSRPESKNAVVQRPSIQASRVQASRQCVQSPAFLVCPHRMCSLRKTVLESFAKPAGKLLCRSLFFNEVVGLRSSTLLKKTSTQVFSCQFCEFYKNSYLEEHKQTAVSEKTYNYRSITVKKYTA